jgi:mannose-6-phosphate isomerase
MADPIESRAPHLRAVISVRDQLSRWLLENALPLWDDYGVDRRSGGYFETLAPIGADAGSGPQTGFAAGGDVRRGRVVARQIYVFAIGERLGWRSPLSSPVEHGSDYLFARLHRDDGMFHTSVEAATHLPNAPFSLYEHAFYLFALAHLNTAHAGRRPIADTAARCLDRLRRGLGRRGGGFEESAPPTLPLRSNPHMHLLEAALAWMAVSEGAAQEPWSDLAREIVRLCLTRFRDPSTGAIREYFDYQWQPAQGDDGRVVEPGHQFEWAWLLMQWARTPQCENSERAICVDAARRLIETAERFGVDAARGVAINELWDDMTVKDSAAKLWPQTERVKAWCAMLDRADSDAETERACRGIVVAAQGLSRYLRTDAPGLWHEVWSTDGEFVPGPARASSLYHVVCAVDALHSAVGAQGGALPSDLSLACG